MMSESSSTESESAQPEAASALQSVNPSDIASGTATTTHTHARARRLSWSTTGHQRRTLITTTMRTSSVIRPGIRPVARESSGNELSNVAFAT